MESIVSSTMVIITLICVVDAICDCRPLVSSIIGCLNWVLIICHLDYLFGKKFLIDPIGPLPSSKNLFTLAFFLLEARVTFPDMVRILGACLRSITIPPQYYICKGYRFNKILHAVILRRRLFFLW